INGIIMNNFDENNWCNNILNLINNKDLSEKIKENSKNTIKNNFNWNSISSLFLNNLDLGRK
ncbi:MAG: hypothetical protein ACLSBN_16025, partial [Clostridium perfringens]